MITRKDLMGHNIELRLGPLIKDALKSEAKIADNIMQEIHDTTREAHGAIPEAHDTTPEAHGITQEADDTTQKEDKQE